MSEELKRHGQKLGLPPGTLRFVGQQRSENVRLQVVDYDAVRLDEYEADRVGDWSAYATRPSTTWVQVKGLHQVEIIEELGTAFQVPELVLEDVLNTGQRPKVEFYEGGLYTVMKFFTMRPGTDILEAEQISFVLGANHLISFQESDRPLFDPVHQRLHNPRSRLRRSTPDYLLYCLMDLLVDHYFVVLEDLGERIESLEEALLEDAGQDLIRKIHHLRRQCLLMRKAVVPLREAVGLLWREEESLISPATHPYLRDLYDHVLQVLDTLENYREMSAALLEVYLSSVSNRMNEVMKVLTIMATIFIPITFIAGVYGMNFEYMPELKWPWGYPLVWLIMIGIAGGMLAFFKNKRWL